MAESGGPGDAAGSGDRGAAPDTGIACLSLLLRFHGMAADPAQLAHEYAPASGGVDLLELTRAAREQGLKAGVRRLALDRLHRAALPAIAEAADGSFFVLARADGEKVLVQRPGAPPETSDRAALAARWTGRAQLPGGGRRFGLARFVPAPVRRWRLLPRREDRGGGRAESGAAVTDRGSLRRRARCA